MPSSGCGAPSRLRLPRRRLLVASLSLAAAGGACARPVNVAGRADNELYVSLARSRTIAVLDTTDDHQVARLPLAPLGWSDPAGQVAVGPGGQAALLPLRQSGAHLGILSHTGSSLEAEHAPLPPAASPERALLLTADAAGSAYVLVADPFAIAGGSVAVVDLARGLVTHQLAIGGSGEKVIALAAHPTGRYLYAALVQCDEADGQPGNWVGRGGSIVAVETRQGRVIASVALPAQMAATSLTCVAPPGSGRAGDGADRTRLYAVATSPPPVRSQPEWMEREVHSTLLALDGADLELAEAWPLGDFSATAAFRPDGRRVYLLRGFGSLRRDLLSLELPGGAVAAQWPVPDTAYEMAATAVGKLYVNDLEHERMLAFDMRTDRRLPAIDLGDVPVALASRPT